MSEERKGTKVYGTSDDLLEFEGDLSGEVGCYDDAILVVCSDGTAFMASYGKEGLGGVWGITVLREGDLLDRLDVCTDEDADPYSDVLWFKPGPLKAWAAKGAERVR